MKEARYVFGASPSYQTNWPFAGFGMKPASITPAHLRHDSLSAISLTFLPSWIVTRPSWKLSALGQRKISPARQNPRSAISVNSTMMRSRWSCLSAHMLSSQTTPSVQFKPTAVCYSPPISRRMFSFSSRCRLRTSGASLTSPPRSQSSPRRQMFNHSE